MQTLMPTIRPTALVPIFGGFTLGSRLWDVAGRIPGLDLRFADNKSLTDAVTGASLVTFARASSGTFVDSAGVLQTAAIDVPRFDHNPTTGESLGLLVEEQRTNLLLRSEEFGTTWITFRASVSADATTAPNGSTTADKIVEDTTASNNHGVQQTGISFVASTTYTFSVFLKPAERSNARIGIPGFVAQFNLQALSVTALTAGATAAIQMFANGWFRCSVTATVASTASGSVSVSMGETSASTTINYTGDGTSGIYLWGAQVEAGAFPTSYIPTTTAAATRSADVASITGTAFSGWYRQDEGSFYSDSLILRSQIKTQVVWSAEGGTFSTSLRQPHGTTNQFRALVNNVFTASTGANITDGATKAAVAYSGAQGRLQVGTAGADATGAGTSDAITLSIGNTGGGTQLNGHIRRIVFWRVRFPNTTLETLTQ